MASEWFYTSDGKGKSGPVSSGQLQALAKSGKLKPTDKVWKEGMAKWVPANTIKALFPSGGESVTASTATGTDKGRSKTRPTPATGKRSRASDDEAEPAEERGGRGKVIAFVAIAAIACVICLGGAIVVGAWYLNSGTSERILAENNEKPKEVQAAAEEKKEPPTGQPKDKTAEKKEAPTEQPKDKTAEKKEAPTEEPKNKGTTLEPTKDKVDEKKDTPPDTLKYDFSKVDYTYDFSKVDYTNGPEGQKLIERSGEEHRREAGEPTPNLIRFVEQGYDAEKQPTPADIADSASRLQDKWAARYPNANAIYLKRVKALTAKKTLPKPSPLPPVPLRPGITDFRYLTKTAVDEDIVVNKQQKAILMLVEGQQLAGELHSLDSKEVQFQPAQAGAKLIKFEASKVKAVQTGSDTYFYGTGKKSFVSLNGVLKSTFAADVALTNLKIHPKAIVLLVSGEQLAADLHVLTSKNVIFKPTDKAAAMNASNVTAMRSPPGTYMTKASNVKYVQTAKDTYIFNPHKGRFVSLASLLEDINREGATVSDEEVAETWMQLRQGIMPANFEFLGDGKRFDMNRVFVRHGRTKGDYLLKDEARIAYEEFWFKGLKHGSNSHYYQNGKKKADHVFVNGFPHGIQRDYFDNGQPKMESHRVQGKKHGTEKSFHPNGKPDFLGAFVDGKPVGEHRSFYSDGKPNFQGAFLDGKPVGEHKSVFSDGKPRFQGRFVDGKPVGLHKQSAEMFVKGYEIYYNDNGIKDGLSVEWVIGRVSNLNYGKLFKIEEGTYSAGKKVGVWTTWDALKGHKYGTATYRDDLFHGEDILYFPNGQVHYTRQWANGLQHGKEIRYYESGKAEMELDWLNGRKHGFEIHYFLTGSITKKIQWVNGVERN